MAEDKPQPQQERKRPAPAQPKRPGAAAPQQPERPAEPDPREVVRLKEVAPDLEWERVHGYVEVTVTPAALLSVARTARDELGFDYLSSITAVDYLDHVLMVYHLYSFRYDAQPTCVVLKTRIPRDGYPLVDSLTVVWAGAEFQEREVWDLMGVKFMGHPDLRRILLSDDFPGHPLRKDFQFDYDYVLVRHLRHGAAGQDREGYVPPHEQVP